MIIGIAGKVGSGKTFVGERLAKQLGWRFIKLDVAAVEVANTRFLKWLLQLRIKHKIPPATDGVQIFPMLKNMSRHFSALEYRTFMYLLNRRLEKMMRSGENLVVDFVVLTALKASKKCDKIIVIESDNEKRVERIMARDSLTAEQVKKIDLIVDRYCDYSGLDRIFNDYKSEAAVKVALDFVHRAG